VELGVGGQGSGVRGRLGMMNDDEKKEERKGKEEGKRVRR
jgi:hypothetical protein